MVFYEVNHEEIKKLVSPAVYEMLIKSSGIKMNFIVLFLQYVDQEKVLCL